MSETPEMVERVARACAAARFGTIVDRIYWNQESDSWRQAHIDIALAAIEALCEPTEMMLCECTDAWGDPIGTGKDFWHAMIDAALRG
jgi:hypothetical protein